MDELQQHSRFVKRDTIASSTCVRSNILHVFSIVFWISIQFSAIVVYKYYSVVKCLYEQSAEFQDQQDHYQNDVTRAPVD